MKFKLKYGSNFSIVDGIQTFDITNTINKGIIEVVTEDAPNDFQNVSGYKFTFTRNGQQIGESKRTSNKKTTLDFSVNTYGGTANWGVEVIVYVSEYDPFEQTGEDYEYSYPITGVFKVIDKTFLPDDDEADDAGTGTSPNQGTIYTDIPSKIHQRFTSIITKVYPEENKFETKKALSDDLPDSYQFTPNTYDESYNWAIKSKEADYKSLNTLIDFGDGHKSVIVNSQIDAETIKIEPYSIVLKTYENVPEDVQIKQNVSIVQEIAEPIREKIRLYPFDEAELGNPILRQPNNKSKDYINNSRTQEKSLEDLYTNNNFLSSSLFNEVLSGSNSADINVDYNDYGNYSIFGSVEKRIQNFRTKLERYEYYSSESGSLAVKAASTGSVYESEIVKNEELKNNIINNFDHYEKYLYYESSSANSSSFGLEFDTSWPKENSSKPHNPLSITASAATTWYNNNTTSASIYDQNNPNRLINLIPEHIKRDSENQPFLDFLDMVGHYYDNIWIYINAFKDTYDRSEKLTEGLSKDLVWAVSNAFGWKQPSGKELLDLHRYIKGYHLSGSATSSTYEVYSTESEKDIEREIWGRILSSMPYILKKKGTKESVQAIVNSYGIPPTILNVKEYGGPDVKEYQPNFDTQQRFTKALDFKGSQYILSSWFTSSEGSSRTPDSIEFRFKTPTGSNQVLLAKDNEFVVRLKETSSISDNKGSVEFLISSSLGSGSVSSSEFPIYNNEFWSVGITRETGSGYDQEVTAEFDTTASIKYNLYVKQYESGRSKILYDSATSMTLSGSTAGTGLTSSLLIGQWTSSGDLYWGSTGSFTDMGVEFSGSLQELRLWNAPLTESAFNNHTRAPKAINGNHASASYTDLIFRLRLDDNKDLSSSPGLNNIAPNQSFKAVEFQSGSAIGFTANTFTNVEQEEKALTPNVGYGLSNSKVRVERNWIPSGSGLSREYRTEESSYDTSPLDSNKLGIFFSPQDVINRDIVESLGDIDFDQEIGDPRDEEEYFYRGLRKLADSYFQKYTGTNNFWEYMRLVKYYDQAIFEQIKKVVPARNKLVYGLLIEPTILQRTKEIISKPPSIDNISYEGELNVGNFESSQSWRRPVMSMSATFEVFPPDITAAEAVIAFTSSIYESSFYKIGTGSATEDNRYSDSFVRTASTGSQGSDFIRQPDILFNEAVSLFVSSSRENEKFEEMEIFYTQSAAIGTAGAGSIPVRNAPMSSSDFHAYSSSFKAAEFQPPSDYLSGYDRSAYSGVKNTIDTTSDKELPIIVQASSPAAVVSTNVGEGKTLQVGASEGGTKVKTTEDGGDRLEVVRKK